MKYWQMEEYFKIRTFYCITLFYVNIWAVIKFSVNQSLVLK